MKKDFCIPSKKQVRKTLTLKVLSIGFKERAGASTLQLKCCLLSVWPLLQCTFFSFDLRPTRVVLQSHDKPVSNLYLGWFEPQINAVHDIIL